MPKALADFAMSVRNVSASLGVGRLRIAAGITRSGNVVNAFKALARRCGDKPLVKQGFQRQLAFAPAPPSAVGFAAVWNFASAGGASFWR